MPTWLDIAADPEFQALPSDAQQLVRQKYTAKTGWLTDDMRRRVWQEQGARRDVPAIDPNDPMVGAGLLPAGPVPLEMPAPIAKELQEREWEGKEHARLREQGVKFYTDNRNSKWQDIAASQAFKNMEPTAQQMVRLAFYYDRVNDPQFDTLAEDAKSDVRNRLSEVLFGGPEGTAESFKKREWLESLPFVGGGITAERTRKLNEAIQGLRTDPSLTEPQDRVYWKKVVDEWLTDQAIAEARGGRTWVATIANGIADTLPFAAEFILTYGAAGAAQAAATGAVGSGLLGKAAGFAASAGTRVAAMSSRAMAAAEGFKTPKGLYWDNGGLRAKEEGAGDVAATARGIGNLMVEVVSEYSGALLSKIPGVRNVDEFFGKMFKAAARKLKIDPDKVGAAFKKAGFDGIVGEVGEERVGDFMHAVFNTQDFGLAAKDNTTLNRLAEAWRQGTDPRQLAQEFATFAGVGLVGVSATALAKAPSAGRKAIARALGVEPSALPEGLRTQAQREAAWQQAREAQGRPLGAPTSHDLGQGGATGQPTGENVSEGISQPQDAQAQPQVVAEPAPTEPVQSRFATQMADTFQLTPDEGQAVEALVDAMGLNKDRIGFGTAEEGAAAVEQSRAAENRGVGQAAPHGAVRFVKSGKAILYGISQPDVGTAIHEVAHVARVHLFDRSIPAAERAGVSEADIAAVEKWAGAKDGNWTRQANERFAQGFQKYLRDGKAPTPGLRLLFAKLSRWLRTIYRKLTTSPFNVRMSKEVRRAFDRAVQRGEASRAAAEAEASVEAARKAQETLDALPPEAREADPVYEAIPNPLQNPVDAWALIDEWHRQRDLGMFDANVQAIRHKDELGRAAGTIGKITGEGRYGEAAKQLSAAIQLHIDLRNNPRFLGAIRFTPRQQALVDLSQNLPPAAQAIADQIIAENQALGSRGLRGDVIARAYEYYTARMYRRKEGEFPGDKTAKFGQKTARGKKRTLHNILHAWLLGKELAVQGAVEAQQLAHEQVAQAIADRNLIKAGLRAGTMSVEQLPGYKLLTHPNMTTWVYRGTAQLDPNAQIDDGSWVVHEPTGRRGRVSFNNGTTAGVWFPSNGPAAPEESVPMSDLKAMQPRGRNFMVQDDGTVLERVPLYAPADVAKHLNNALGVSSLQGIWLVDRLTEWGARLKKTILSYSLFHHQAFARSAGLGGREINPVEIYKAGRQLVMEHDATLRLLAGEGLTLGREQEFDFEAANQKTIIGKVIDHVPGAKEAKDVLIAVADHQVDFLFHKLGPYLKAQTAVVEFHAQVRKHADALRRGEITERDIAGSVARLLNDDFGGLHLQRLGRNPTLQHIFRILALAPDWTWSNVRSFIKAFGTGREAAIYRAMWGRIALKGAAATILANLVLSFMDDKDFVERYKAAWKSGRLRWLGVDITPIYRMFGGQSGRRKYFNLFGHFLDPVKWLSSPPSRTAKAKGSPLLRAVVDAWTGRDWADRPFTTAAELFGVDDKGVYKRRVPGKHSVGERKGGQLAGRLVKTPWDKGGTITWAQLPSYLAYEARGAAPIQAQSMAAYIAGEIDGFDFLAQAIGIDTSTSYEKPEGR